MKRSETCRMNAEELEQLARVLSLKPDREHYARRAADWRLQESQALVLEQAGKA